MSKDGKYENLIGQKFNKLTVISLDKERTSKNKNGMKYWWSKCDCGKITNKSASTSDLKSNNTKSCGLCFTFEEWCIENDRQDVLDRWDYILNKLKPSEISYKSSKKYWFKCLNNKEHKSELRQINVIIINKDYNIICTECNSFAQWGIDNLGSDFLDKYWSDKNTLNPWEISYRNNKYIWINCVDVKYHDTYKCRPVTFVKGHRCPSCSQERNESFLQEKIRLYLEELNYKLLHERSCSILPINPKTNYILPFDNEIEELKLIVEVHGEQHYKVTNYSKMTAKKNNTTPNQELHYQQLKDRYKRIKAKQQGYEFLEIPYWTDDDDKTWKKLINDKIKEIQENAKLNQAI